MPPAPSSALDAYLSALNAGEAPERLFEAEATIAKEEGPLTLVRCLDARLDHAIERGASEEELAPLKERLAEACEAAARLFEGERSRKAALRAVVLRREMGDEEAIDLAIELLFCLGPSGKGLDRALLAAGGAEAALEALRRRLRRPEVKKDAAKTASLRRALSRLCEHTGDVDGAFFEMLKAVRKAPEEPLYVDEAFRLALATSRYEELLAVFSELAEDEALPGRQRAMLFNKVGHLAERGLEDLPRALLAYERSLALYPASKGARRHAERLRGLLRDAALKLPAEPVPPVREEATARAPVPASATELSSAYGSELETLEEAAQKIDPPEGGEEVQGPKLASSLVVSAELFLDEASLDAEARVFATSDEPHPFDETEATTTPEPRPRRKKRKRKKQKKAKAEAKVAASPLVDGADAPPASPPPLPPEDAPTRRTALAEVPTKEPAPLTSAPPPSHLADPMAMGEATRDLFDEAGQTLAARDPKAALRCAEELESHPARGSLVLRLAAHALLLRAKEGEQPPRAVALFVAEADAHPDLAARLAAELWEETPQGRRAAIAEIGRHLARSLGEDAPDEQVLALLSELALELLPDDEGVRALAVDAFEARAAPKERARFFGRLARKVDGEEAVPLLRRLLRDRLATEDALGAEAAARDLLMRRPGDDEATKALVELFAAAPHRRGELAQIRRLRLTKARSRRDQAAARKEAQHLFALLVELERFEEAKETLLETLAEEGDDEALIRFAAKELEVAQRFCELLSLYEALAERLEKERAAEMLLLAAEVARRRLAKRSQAEALLERALEIAPEHTGALVAKADLAAELGDAQGALVALERLAARQGDPIERAHVHFRLGRLLEEHLLRPEEAIKRYRACVQANPGHRQAWEALLALARQRKEVALEVEALFGLVALEKAPAERAALYKQIALLERDERVDLDAAEEAFQRALREDPSDPEAVEGVLALLSAKVLGEPDLKVALADPKAPLLDAAFERLACTLTAYAEADPDDERFCRLPFAVRRLFALAILHKGALDEAMQLFTRLLEEAPTDLPVLRAAARALAEGGGSEESAEARLRILERILLHHAPDLPKAEQVALWGDVGALRLVAQKTEQAQKALKKALELAADEALRAALSEEAVLAIKEVLADAGEVEPRLKVAALRLFAERQDAAAAASVLAKAARVARQEAGDAALAQKLLAEAMERDPTSREALSALLDLHVEEGSAEAAIAQARALLVAEEDPAKKASLHVRLAGLFERTEKDDEAVAEHLKEALRLAPESREAQAAAERFFEKKGDAEGLAALYAAQLRGIDPKNVKGRLSLLERLAQVRRYDLRDLVGAAEALEAMGALDPDAIKPREDAARIYTELGRWREAAAAWRGVLERDPLAPEAWRGLFSLYARSRQPDEAFAVAAAMVAVELAEEEMAQVVRRIRPPFPRWPRAPKDARAFKSRLAHPLERTPMRAVFDLIGQRAHPLFARPLKDFGLRRKDRLSERTVPSSVLLAVRTVAELLGLSELPALYRAELGAMDGMPPPFALLPCVEPSLVVSDEVLRGGMTPERAFALGRAMAWLVPHARLASTLSPAELKEVLEALVLRFLPGAEAQGETRRLEKLGLKLEAALFDGLGATKTEALKEALVAQLRDYVFAREQLHIADWLAGLGYTGDRVGFLLVGDLAPSVRVIQATAGSGHALGARLAIKELVLFSVSAAYLSLRRELGVGLPKEAARPILDLA